MSPELIGQSGDTSWRPTVASDIYALAITLWEVLRLVKCIQKYTLIDTCLRFLMEGIHSTRLHT
jgi:hypothetical protein